MECAVCKQSVAKFDLINSKPTGIAKTSARDSNSSSTGEDPHNAANDNSFLADASFMGPLFSSSTSSSNGFDHEEANNTNGDLESAFEFGLDFDVRASTPKLEQQLHDSSHPHSHSYVLPKHLRTGEENVVLRIDNVPWVRCL